mmetsp:Transcript_124335/g.357292  ORF Transcript_124335/g.357292 Transcript_124335/m.357292 type:complete len:375 (-) Transcript_124335:183-1307(-)
MAGTDLRNIRYMERPRAAYSNVGAVPRGPAQRQVGTAMNTPPYVGYAAGNVPAYKGVPDLHRPAAPMLPNQLNGVRSHATSSRSVPPGSRAGPTRPSTPSNGQPGGVPRRDDVRFGGSPHERVGSGSSVLSGAGSVADGGREPPGRPAESAPVNGSHRSRSAAAPHSRTAGTAVVGAAGDGSRCSSSSTCDKCDGKHPSDRCPHFHRDREKHKDAWVNYGKKGGPHQMGSDGGNFVLRSARVLRQPGDGNCLFHSLNACLASGGSASTLRREIATFLQQNPSLEIAGDTLEEWVRWDSNSTVSEYAKRMAYAGWGGGIEMACCSLLKKVNVHVYEAIRRGSEFKRISCFDSPTPTKTIHVLYQGGVHYDALQPL